MSICNFINMLSEPIKSTFFIDFMCPLVGRFCQRNMKY